MMRRGQWAAPGLPPGPGTHEVVGGRVPTKWAKAGAALVEFVIVAPLLLLLPWASIM